MKLSLKNFYPNSTLPHVQTPFTRGPQRRETKLGLKDGGQKNTLRYFFASKKTQGERIGENTFQVSKKKTAHLLFLFLFLFHFIVGKSKPELMLFCTKDISPLAKEITITFTVLDKDFIYKDFITCSIDEPTVTLSAWKTDTPSINHYDPSFKEAKQIFNETFSITMVAIAEQWISEPIHLYCSYYRKTDKKINDALFTFSFEQPINTNINLDGTIENTVSSNFNTPHYAYHHFSLVNQYYKKLCTFLHKIIAVFMHYRTECLSLFLVLMSLLILLFYAYQENIKKHTIIYELLEMVLSLSIFIILSCGIWQLHGTNKPLSRLLACSIAILFLTIMGIFYIKKSTNVFLGTLRTFYTCIGMVLLIGTIFLLFQTIQHIDEHMNLF